jgi:hypothetical protein
MYPGFVGTAPAAAQPQPFPEPPLKLTEGFPDPVSVEQQKLQYAASLEARLKSQTDELTKQSDLEKKILAEQAAAAKAHFNLQVDTALQQQARALDEQTNAAMLAVHEKAVQQKSALEGQAAGLKLEFEQKKAQESMMIRQYEIQKQYYEKQMQLQSQMSQLGPRPPGMPVVPGMATVPVPGLNPQAMPQGFPQGMVTAMPGSQGMITAMPGQVTFGAWPQTVQAGR